MYLFTKLKFFCKKYEGIHLKERPCRLAGKAGVISDSIFTFKLDCHGIVRRFLIVFVQICPPQRNISPVKITY